MDLSLNGKRAIVTGGSRGIGRSIAEALLQEGASVAICARGEEGLRASEAELGALGTVYAATADMADRAAVQRFVSDAAEALGGIDILVHNTSAAGAAEGVEGWTNTFNVDVVAGVTAVEAAMPSLEASDAASIVFIGTIASIEAFGGAGPYGPLKAAMRAYTNDLGQTLAPKGIRVNVVSPGSINFEGGFWQRVEQEAPEYFESVLNTIPMGRYGSPEEVARVVAFVASPAASWVTSTNIVVDGGQHKSVN
jgi:NAD(P)-dependent dehydrogenase (short-subunit alcohol dehydrogenase family)